MVRLFDIDNGKIVPTEHCYTLGFLKKIMDKYPDDHMQIYAYLFYMTCPDPEFNPYFDMPEDNKEEHILRQVGGNFNSEDDEIREAIKACHDLYETPTVRAYRGIKTMLDRLAEYLETAQIEHGRDGNINSLIQVAKSYDSIRASFKGAYKDLRDEQDVQTRGGSDLAYDQS